MPRRLSRSARREERFQAHKATARTGRQHLVASWEWLRAELTALAEADPRREDAACRHLAEQLEAIARDTAKEAARADNVPVH